MPRRAGTTEERKTIQRAIGRRIRQARKEAGLTQAELAAAVGYSNNWLHEIEIGENAISAPDLQRVAHLVGYPIGYFTEPNYETEGQTPKTRFEWKRLFPGEEARALAHAQLDEVFRSALGRSTNDTLQNRDQGVVSNLRGSSGDGVTLPQRSLALA